VGRDLDWQEGNKLLLIRKNETLSHVLEHRFTAIRFAELRGATLQRMHDMTRETLR
jgi:hypothetical protein